MNNADTHVIPPGDQTVSEYNRDLAALNRLTDLLKYASESNVSLDTVSLAIKRFDEERKQIRKDHTLSRFTAAIQTKRMPLEVASRSLELFTDMLGLKKVSALRSIPLDSGMCIIFDVSLPKKYTQDNYMSALPGMIKSVDYGFEHVLVTINVTAMANRTWCSARTPSALIDEMESLIYNPSKK